MLRPKNETIYLSPEKIDKKNPAEISHYKFID